MKKVMLRGIVIIMVALIVGSIVVLLDMNKQDKVENFSLEDYREEINSFPGNQNVGTVENADAAKKHARMLWREKFNVSDIAGITSAWDPENKCWHIYNITHANVLGGVFHAIIQKNGDVVAVWAED